MILPQIQFHGKSVHSILDVSEDKFKGGHRRGPQAGHLALGFDLDSLLRPWFHPAVQLIARLILSS